jgi:hypothetical protein
MEKAAKLKKKVIGAMIYPAVVITIAVGIVSMIMIFVIPKFRENDSSRTSKPISRPSPSPAASQLVRQATAGRTSVRPIVSAMSVSRSAKGSTRRPDKLRSRSGHPGTDRSPASRVRWARLTAPACDLDANQQQLGNLGQRRSTAAP